MDKKSEIFVKMYHCLSREKKEYSTKKLGPFNPV